MKYSSIFHDLNTSCIRALLYDVLLALLLLLLLLCTVKGCHVKCAQHCSSYSPTDSISRSCNCCCCCCCRCIFAAVVVVVWESASLKRVFPFLHRGMFRVRWTMDRSSILLRFQEPRVLLCCRIYSLLLLLLFTLVVLPLQLRIMTHRKQKQYLFIVYCCCCCCDS